jgi:transposase
MNAILYVAEQDCKWRGLPRRFGNWHTIYTRMNRWAKAGVLDRIFVALQEQQIIHIKIEAMSTDSTVIKVHPDGTGALKKRPAGHRKVLWRLDHRDSYGCRGCSNGHSLLTVARSKARRTGRPRPAPYIGTSGGSNVCMVMDWAYGGDATRQLVLDLGFTPFVQPMSNRIDSWEYDRVMYRRRNEIERLFR